MTACEAKLKDLLALTDDDDDVYMGMYEKHNDDNNNNNKLEMQAGQGDELTCILLLPEWCTVFLIRRRGNPKIFQSF